MSRHYRLARWSGLHSRRAADARSTRPPIVVHQMGKVGSTAVTAAIGQEFPDRTVYQLHHLSAEALCSEEQLYAEGFRQRRRIDGHLLNSLYVRRELDRGRLPASTPIISLVRDPMAQRYSSFFQTLPFRVPDLERRVRTEDPKTLAQVIAGQFLGDGWWHDDRIATFFHKDFEPAWGIDVFGHPFDQDQGWQTYEFDARRAFVMRYEDLSRDGMTGLASFLGVEALQLPRLQVSADKYYAGLQSRVRRELVLDESYLDRAYATPEVEHFYSPQAIGQFRAKWES
jgi:hypothetical protein